jgi:hypothetical protein
MLNLRFTEVHKLSGTALAQAQAHLRKEMDAAGPSRTARDTPLSRTAQNSTPSFTNHNDGGSLAHN